MAEQHAYMIVDIGTGNVRVAITLASGEILSIERGNVEYERDALYPDALHFHPERLWKQILGLAERAIQNAKGVKIAGITTSSQREGIVILDAAGKGLIGLPNHDHRGREWEDVIVDKSRVYVLTGRYPSSLFSAFKVLGIKNRREDIFSRMKTMLSISDWASFMLTGVAGYEHSQASETQLYDVAGKRWSPELCDLFGLDPAILPALHQSGTIIGKILPALARQLNVNPDALVVVGGADTQLAIHSTQPAVGDIVIVSGTTTPIVKVTDQYLVDRKERSWTNRHIDADGFVLETNAGVTGLNYQRLKAIFYPNEAYAVIGKELDELTDPSCMASLGSLLADEKDPLTRGGFVINVPISHELTRASFVWAALWDIACCIRENFYCLTDIAPYDRDYVWACGGGFQSRMLSQAVADLIQKKIRLRPGFQHASVTGGTAVCNAALGVQRSVHEEVQEITPRRREQDHALYREWKKVREHYRKTFPK
jgi:autoinducer-2 kinase